MYFHLIWQSLAMSDESSCKVFSAGWELCSLIYIFAWEIGEGKVKCVMRREGALGWGGNSDSPDHLHFCPLLSFCFKAGMSRAQPADLRYHLSVPKIQLSLYSPERQKNEFPALPQTPASPKSPSRGILLPKPRQSRGLRRAQGGRGAPAPRSTSASTELGERGRSQGKGVILIPRGLVPPRQGEDLLMHNCIICIHFNAPFPSSTVWRDLSANKN